MHTSTAQIAAWLGLPSQADDPALNTAAAAANEIATRYVGDQVTDSSTAAATMLGARLVRRRNSAEGVQQLTAEFGMRVASSDPDIARLLRIEQFDVPEVG